MRIAFFLALLSLAFFLDARADFGEPRSTAPVSPWATWTKAIAVAIALLTCAALDVLDVVDRLRWAGWWP